MFLAMAVVGFWVTDRIERAVVQNSALSAAVYADSFISPLSQDLASDNEISEPAKQALREIFRSSGLSERVVSYKIWKPGGLVAFSNDPNLVGRNFGPTEELKAAWQGKIAGSFEDLDHEESAAEAALDIPLLEVYAPILGTFTGEVIAVAELYQRADGLSADLRAARRSAWFLVGAVFLASGTLLFGIVSAGGRVISKQSRQLAARVAEVEEMNAQNIALKATAISATARSMAHADRNLRRLGADLHDGPAQHLALANLRLEAALKDNPSTTAATDDVRSSINEALTEIRDISRGLASPDLENLSVEDIVSRASVSYTNDGLLNIEARVDVPVEFLLGYSHKLALLRFLQETLSNASRYAAKSNVNLQVLGDDEKLLAVVSDDGPGFKIEDGFSIRDDGGQGLPGLKDRAESLGGNLTLKSSLGKGFYVQLVLPLAADGVSE